MAFLRHRDLVIDARRLDEGMSCSSVPPHATFITWRPRQMASIGRCASTAARTSAISCASRPGSAGVIRRVRLLAEQRRIDVAAAGQQDAVELPVPAATGSSCIGSSTRNVAPVAQERRLVVGASCAPGARPIRGIASHPCGHRDAHEVERSRHLRPDSTPHRPRATRERRHALRSGWARDDRTR